MQIPCKMFAIMEMKGKISGLAILDQLSLLIFSIDNPYSI